MWKDQPYDSKSDIWSLGCVLYESVTLKPPFRADDMAGLYKKVVKGVYPKIPTHFSSELNNLLRCLLVVQSTLRPSCEQIMTMPAVRKAGERIFGSNFADEVGESQQLDLLSTITVPKNLLYLTDRLPKPHYYDTRNGQKFSSATNVRTNRKDMID